MRIENVSLGGAGNATLSCYLPDPRINSTETLKRPALLILPGSGYMKLAIREGEPVALRFAGFGYAAFVLHYTTVVAEGASMDDLHPNAGSHYPLQCLEAMRAMEWIRDHAGEMGVDATRVYALGFSAGAHVLLCMCERYDDTDLLRAAGLSLGSDEVRRLLPERLLLCYPMVTANLVRDAWDAAAAGGTPREVAEWTCRGVFGKTDPTEEDYAMLDTTRHIRPELPPTFVWQTADDDVVNPRETLQLVSGLMAADVPCELHLFESGPHGMSLADRTVASDPAHIDARVAGWVDLARSWLEAKSGRKVPGIFLPHGIW